jgi:hypothetical protein
MAQTLPGHGQVKNGEEEVEEEERGNSHSLRLGDVVLSQAAGRGL